MAQTRLDSLRADGDALIYLRSLTANLVARPGAYGVSQAEADHLGMLVGRFADALAAARNPLTRTAGAVAAKDMARADAMGLARAMIRQIKVNQGVSVEDKLSAGIPLPRVGPGVPIGPPTAVPVLQIVSSVRGFQVLQYGATAGEGRRRKPLGVQLINVFVELGDAEGSDPEKARLLQGYTRNPIGVAFKPGENLKIATYWGCWVNPRGGRGPWSAPVSMVVAA